MKRVFLTFYLFLIFSLLFVQFILGPVIGKVAEVYLQDAIVEYNRQLAKGAFHMLELDLLRLPKNEWDNRILELEPQFGYAIGLFGYDELELAEEQLDQLRQGKIAVVDDGEGLFHQIGESGMVLRKGPFSQLEPKSGFFNVAIWFAITAIVGFLTLIWIIPYWRKLRKISIAAMVFGNGDFNVRADISKRSSLTPIATAFNTMAERIQQLINSHKELTNAVSHELRTPLSRLRFGLEMLETSEDMETRAHYARELQIDVADLEELVSELLTFARFDRERPELQFGFHLLEPFLHQLLAESFPDECPIHYQIHNYLDEQSGKARFEPKYLARALGNLIQNALRHADCRIQVIVERNGGDCIIHLDDDGVGIREPDRQRVFEPFTRLDASRNRKSGGYGLGLAIVMRILKWHNGRVTVGDSPLGGARLTISWPGFSQF
jgi:signal transduction histidine kinase